MVGRKVPLGLLVAWTLLFAVVPVASAADPWRHEDPQGDVEFREWETDAEAAVPVGPLSDTVDLREVRIEAEDDRQFRVVLRVTEFSVETGTSPTSHYASFSFSFAYQDVHFYASAGGTVTPSSTQPGKASIDPNSQAFFSGNRDGAFSWQRVPVHFDDATNEVRFTVPKAALFGGAETRLATSLRAGDELNAFSARTSMYLDVEAVDGQLSDSLPERGDVAPYRFTTDAANARLAVFLPSAVEVLPVEPGSTVPVPFTVRNAANGKRTVSVAYELEGADDKRARYELAGPSVVTVPAQSVRNFTFQLTASEDARRDDAVRLVVRVQAVGHPDDRGVADAILRASPALGPTANRLYLQAQEYRHASAPFDPHLCATAFVPCTRGFLSAHASDPRATPGRAVEGFADELGPDGTFFGWDFSALDPLPVPAALDKTKPIQLEVILRSDVPLNDVQVGGGMAWVRGSRYFDLGWFEGTASSSPEGERNVFSIPVRSRTTTIPAGAHLAFGFGIGEEGPGASAGAFATTGIEVITGSSFLQLPLTELPEDLRAQTVASPFQLGVLGERESYVNPGKSTKFRLTLLNHDDRSARAQFETAGLPEGWKAEFRPAATYELVPGDAIVVDLLVTAPAGSPDGTQTTLRVNLTSPGAATLSLNLVATAVESVTVDDAATDYVPDDEAQAKAVKPADRDAPAMGLVGALAALLVGLRRRV